jgi:hypothetical protein
MSCTNKITTLAEFREYIKISLGAPVICLELSDDQIDISIKDSIDYAYRYLYGEALYEDYMAFTVSAGVSAYTLDDDIEDAFDLTFNASTTGSLLFNAEWMMLNNSFNFYGVGGGGGLGGGSGGSITSLGQGMGMAGAQIAYMYHNDIQNYYGALFSCKYRENRQELVVTPTPSSNGVGLISVWRRENCNKLYNHILIRQLAVAKSKKIWATNLKKYSITMPGQATVNGDVLYQDAIIEEDKALDSILSESTPPDFYIA